ncbi:MAG TPA: AMP-binding protein [Xanthobacteraceae bacterium]|nr:AMP-binding protein [Xanthobacteraceae bacterium]
MARAAVAMMLGDPAAGQSRITLDGLFRRNAARRPGAIALADAPNRPTFTDGAPLQLTYAEADRMISAIAGRLRRLGLPTDAIVGIQMPNIAETVLTFLGVIRAGLIPAPLPLLWRRADAVSALARVGARALIACGRVGGFKHCRLAARVAAEVFSIRCVCGFGEELPDGVVPLDDLFTAAKLDSVPPLDRGEAAAAHVAVVTFEVGEDGPVPVARRHLECLAGGVAVLLESRLEQEANVLSTVAPASFAGICLTLVPWLLTGGTLVLHQPFEPDIFARQRREHRCGTLILPAAVAFRLAETGLFAREGPTTVLAVWQAPERLAASPEWPERDAVLIDVPVFGEAGLVAARRGGGGRAAPIPLGVARSPREGKDQVAVLELGITDTNTLSLRGPMVPCHPFPPGIERSDQPHFEISRDGVVDTGFVCRVDRLSRTIVVTGPPAGLVNVGGYRFPLLTLMATIGRIDGGAALAALPDGLIGQRLVGTAADLDAMAAALAALGVNPLVVAAFAERGERAWREALAAG